MTRQGAARVTELEEAMLLAGVLIGAFLMALLIGILAIVFHFAEQIDRL